MTYHIVKDTFILNLLINPRYFALFKKKIDMFKNNNL